MVASMNTSFENRLRRTAAFKLEAHVLSFIDCFRVQAKTHKHSRNESVKEAALRELSSGLAVE